MPFKKPPQITKGRKVPEVPKPTPPTGPVIPKQMSENPVPTGPINPPGIKDTQRVSTPVYIKPITNPETEDVPAGLKTYTFDEIDQLVEDRMKWEHQWIAGTLYQENDVVRDGVWTMICVNDTDDRPAPQPQGPEIPTYPSDPTWTTEQYTGVVRVGTQHIFNRIGWITGLYVWVPEVTGNYTFRIITIDQTDPNNPIVTVINDPILTPGGWNVISLGQYMVGNGSDIVVFVEAFNSSGTTEVTGTWAYDGVENNNNPPVGRWNHSQNQLTLRINKVDDDSVDRTADLMSFVPGTTVKFEQDPANSIIYSIDSAPADVGSAVEWSVTVVAQLGSIGVGNNCTMTASIPIQEPTKYVQEAGYWGVNPDPIFAEVSGYLELDGVPQTGLADAFGIGITFQEAYISPDWEVVAYSGASGGGGDGGDGGIPEAPTDGVPYGRQDGGWTPVAEDPHTHLLDDVLDNGTLAYVNDAPSDGLTYGRRNGTWAEAGGGGGSTIVNGAMQIALVDDITGSQNGIITQFPLTVDAVSIAPPQAADLLVVHGGVVQEPEEDYQIVAGELKFTTAPKSYVETYILFYESRYAGQWHVDAGVPNDATGNDGDMYLDNVTGDVYGPKDTTWGTPSANIKGPQGEQGEPGSGGVEEAPVDGQEYVRKDAAWSVNSGGGGGVPEAPQDTTLYGRIDATWAAAASSVHNHDGAYAPISHGHIIGDVTGLQTALDGKSPTTHNHDLDYAAIAHGHAISDVTNLQTSLDGKSDTTHNHDLDYAAISHAHAINDVTGLQTALDGKSDTTHNHDGTYSLTTHDHDLDYAAISHAHAIGDVTGLQTALDGKAAVSHTHTLADVTDSGTMAAVNDAPSNGSEYVRKDGLWAVATGGGGGIPDAPSDGTLYGRLNGAWSAAATEGHNHDGVYSLTTHNHDGTYSPVSHNHAIADVTGLQTALDGKAATVHTHAISDVTGLQTALDGKSDTGHGHAISDVTGLQTALDGKSDTTHNHDGTYEPANSNIQTHIGSTSNPHSVTAAQAGAVEATTVGLKAEVVAALPGTPDANTLYFVTG